MLINLTELFSLEGKEKEYSVPVSMDVFHCSRGDYQIFRKEPVSLKIRNIGNKCLLIRGSAELVLGIPCDRCLEPVPVLLKPLFELETDMKKTSEEREEELNEQPWINGYQLDVDKLLFEELLLNMPMKTLCSENCKGICNRCGTNLNHESCDCDTRSLDPRMSAIQDIFKQYKEV